MDTFISKAIHVTEKFNRDEDESSQEQLIALWFATEYIVEDSTNCTKCSAAILFRRKAHFQIANLFD
jgi:hypothetical protein